MDSISGGSTTPVPALNHLTSVPGAPPPGDEGSLIVKTHANNVKEFIVRNRALRSRENWTFSQRFLWTLWLLAVSAWLGTKDWISSPLPVLVSSVPTTGSPGIVVSSGLLRFVFVVVSLCLVVAYAGHRYSVAEESLLVIKDVGVQIKTTFSDGRSESRFLDQANIMEIIINEGMTRWQVKYYLAILLRGQTKANVGGGGVDDVGGGGAAADGGGRKTATAAAPQSTRPVPREESERMVVVFQTRDTTASVPWSQVDPATLLTLARQGDDEDDSEHDDNDDHVHNE